MRVSFPVTLQYVYDEFLHQYSILLKLYACAFRPAACFLVVTFLLEKGDFLPGPRYSRTLRPLPSPSQCGNGDAPTASFEVTWLC
jgi:hypothetical protein